MCWMLTLYVLAKYNVVSKIAQRIETNNFCCRCLWCLWRCWSWILFHFWISENETKYLTWYLPAWEFFIDKRKQKKIYCKITQNKKGLGSILMRNHDKEWQKWQINWGNKIWFEKQEIFYFVCCWYYIILS